MAFEDETTCPCCGYFMDVGSYDICEICRWENDPAQRDYPDMDGANRVSLRQGQLNYLEFGVSDPRKGENAREPLPSERKNPRWKLLDPV